MRRAVRSPAVPPPVGHLLSEQVVGKSVEPLVVMLEVGEDGKNHARDARLAATAPSVVDAPVALEPFVQQQRARTPRLPIRRGQTEISQQEHRVGRRGPFWVIQPAVRRFSARPRAPALLPGEKTGAPTLACNFAPLSLNAALPSAGQVAQSLPADCRVAFEQPTNRLIGLACRIRFHGACIRAAAERPG